MNASKTKLVAALSRLSHIPKSGLAPVVRCLMLEATNGVLTISATNGDQYASENLDCDGDLKRTLVPSTAFVPIVTFGVEEQSFTLKDNGRLHCEVGAIIDQPVVVDDWTEPKMDDMKLIGVNCGDLAACIKKVAWAVSTDKSRTNLQGVHVVLSPTRIFCEAFDGVCCALVDHPAIAVDAEFTVHSGFIGALCDALLMPGAQLSTSQSWLNVWHDSGSYSCKQIEEKFMNTARVVSAERTPLGEISRDEWLQIFRCIQSTRGQHDNLSLRTIVDLSETAAVVKAVPSDGGSDYTKEVLGKFETRKLHVNALTFVKCIAAFGEDASIKLKHVPAFDSVALEDGDLCVITTQLRPDVVVEVKA